MERSNLNEKQAVNRVEYTLSIKTRIIILIMFTSLMLMGTVLFSQLSEIRHEAYITRIYTKGIFVKADEINNFIKDLEVLKFRIPPTPPKQEFKDFSKKPLQPTRI